MRILVTGGAGYIGSVTADALVRRGHEVTVLDDLRSGHRDAVPSGATFALADVAEREAVGRVLEASRADAVMHFAASSLVSESMARPMAYFANNTGASLALLDAMVEHDVRRFVLSSTAAVYGTPDAVPIPEDAQVRPESVYGESKVLVERTLAWLARTAGLGYAALRYFNAAGATEALGEDHRPETHLVPLVLQVARGEREALQLFGRDYPTPDGTAVRDYVHVSDLAHAHVLAIEALRPGEARTYNVGTGRGFSVLEVVEACRAVTGLEIEVRDAPRREGDPPRLVADARAIQEGLGWRAEIPDLHDIVASAWRWHRSHPDGYAT
ncbi:MAG: UDP-glucose 4-epimerase GalE [Trueperaceae bacterium]|nr:UDP-glucose 4-epimerase GalE [Trueperaceae bacterium]